MIVSVVVIWECTTGTSNIISVFACFSGVQKLRTGIDHSRTSGRSLVPLEGTFTVSRMIEVKGHNTSHSLQSKEPRWKLARKILQQPKRLRLYLSRQRRQRCFRSHHRAGESWTQQPLGRSESDL